ncbi:MAG: hypothetical protein RBT62_07690 [Spirochaetia bacterium]|jgi:hypothetical protein|nr:hypothetical protein [Spirochaetia bacterium]
MQSSRALRSGFLAFLSVAFLYRIYASPGHEDPSLRIAIATSSLDGLNGDAQIEAGVADFRFHIDWPLLSADDACLMDVPVAAMCLQASGLRLGTMRPAGLMAFVYRPGSFNPLLLYKHAAPFTIDNPKYARYLGLSIGESHGLFIATRMLAGKVVDTNAPAYGAWFSPLNADLSFLALTTIEAAETGGPGWYDVGLPRTHRVFGALSASSAGRYWSVAAAAAGSAAFPGRDACACRIEARAALGRFSLAGEASALGGLWHGPDGYEGSPALNAHAEIHYARRFLSATIGYRYLNASTQAIQDISLSEKALDDAIPTGSSSTSKYTASLETRGTWGLARVSSHLTDAMADKPDGIELDTRIEPELLPWLTIASSWRALDGHAVRFDMLAHAGFAGRLSMSVDAGLRYVPEGTLAKGGISCSLRPSSWSASVSILSDGWIRMDHDWHKFLEYALRLEASLP